jgi:hypothetical protein
MALTRPESNMLKAGVLGAFSQRTCLAASSPGGPPEAMLLLCKPRLMARDVVTLKSQHCHRGVGMKITIELESFAVKALLALSLAVWCAWEGQHELAATGAVLIAALKS